jgi:hypothetical protein
MAANNPSPASLAMAERQKNYTTPAFAAIILRLHIHIINRNYSSDEGQI